MKKTAFLAVSALFLASCGSNAPQEGDKSAVQSDTTAVADVHNAANSLDYWGTYTGTFPAADGPGIATTLTLKKDRTFDLRSVYVDRDSAFDDRGTYTVEGNLITLKTQDGELQYYKAEENRLRRLDSDKKEITGVLADNYILVKN